MEITLKKPTSVKVIGWIFIAVSVLMIFSGAMGLMSHKFIAQMNQRGMAPQFEEMDGPFKTLSVVFKYFDFFAILQIIFATFILISSIQFLKLHAWARTALEIVSWISLIWIISFSMFWIVSWVKITSSIPGSEGISVPPPMFNIFGIIMGIVVMTIWVIPIIVIIKFLRGSTIKESFNKV